MCPIGTTGVKFGGIIESGYETFYALVDNVNGGNWARIGDSMVQIAASPQSSLFQFQSACSYNGLIYLFGGWSSPTNDNSLYSYNPITNTWKTLATATTGCNSPGMVGLNGKIYAIGGATGSGGTARFTSINNVQEYDIASNAWTNKANAPFSQVSGCCTFGGLIYVVTGANYTAAAATIVRTLWSYDPWQDKWASLTNHPNTNGVYENSPIAYGGSIWALTGRDGSSGIALTTNFRYDILSKTWTQLASSPAEAASTDYYISLLNNKAYLLQCVENTSKEVWIYNFHTDLWNKDPLALTTIPVTGQNLGVTAPIPINI